MPTAKKKTEKRKKHVHKRLQQTRDRDRILSQLDAAQNDQEAILALDRLRKATPETIRYVLSHGRTELDIFADTKNPFPKNAGEFAAQLTMRAPGSLSEELNWSVAVLLRHKNRLHDFSLARRKFEQAVISGRYDAAGGFLAAIDSEFGRSYWQMAASFVLAHRTGGLEANRERLNQFKDETKNRTAQLFIQLLSERSETAQSATNFTADINALLRPLASLNKRDIQQAIAHFKFHLNLQDLDEVGELAFFLHRESVHSIPDRYIALVKAMHLLASSTSGRQLAEFGEAILAASAFQAPEVSLLSYLVDPSTRIVRTPEADAYIELLDRYTLGEYEAVSNRAVELLATEPDRFELYELCARSEAHRESTSPDNPFPDGTTANSVFSSVFHVVAKTADTSKHLSSLRNIASQLEGFRFSSQVLAFAFAREGLHHAISPSILALLSAGIPTPRLASYFRSKTDGRRFLRNFHKTYPQSDTGRFFLAVETKPAAAGAISQIPRARRLKYMAHAQFEQDALEAATRAFEELRTLSREDPSVREAAIVGLIACYCKARRLDESAELITSAYLQNPHLLAPSAVSEVVAAATNADYSPGNIDWPIVQFIHIEQRRKPDDWRLYEAYDDFLAGRGIDRPSQLDASEFATRLTHLVFFLRFICVPEIMDYAVVFRNSTDLESERIAVLQKLLELDAANKKTYSDEISKLTLSGAIRKTIQRVDESKIYVDTGGLTRSLDKSFKDRFTRYIAYTRLNTRLRERMAVANFDTQEFEVIIYVSDESLELFKDLFEELKERYISSNEYGLDSYLSVRIRHGTFSGHVRSVFERLNLVTRRNVKTDEYERNEVLLRDAFRFQSSQVLDAVDFEFRKFSREVDKLIERAKTSWIQIKSEAAPEGLFDYEYSEEELGTAFVALIGSDSFEAFVAGVYSLLRTRTEECLTAVRRKIAVSLEPNLIGLLDQVRAELSARGVPIQEGTLAQSLAQCRTDIHNELATVVSWFQHADDKAHPDIALALLVDTSASIIRNFHPHFDLAVSNRVDASIRCDGRAVTPFVDILKILLGNIATHSDGTSARASVSAAMVGGNLELAVSNALPPSSDAASIQKAVEELRGIKSETVNELGMRSEGKSGHRKMHKLIRTDLNRGDNYTASVAIEDGAVFVVRIGMPAAEVVYEDPARGG